MNPCVSFPGRGRSVRVAAGTSLIEAVRAAGLPIASACGADGLCGRCGVEVVEGDAGLAAETAEEASAKRRNRIAPSLRLACRVAVESDLSIDAPYW